MLLSIYTFLAWHTKRLDFPTKFSFLAYVISTYISLVILFYTSKAIGKSFFATNLDYFSYILVGELGLLLVSSVLQQSLTLVRMWMARGIFSYILTIPTSPLKIVVMQLLSKIPKTLMLVLLQLILASLFFDFEISFMQMMVLIFYPVLSLLMFIGLSLIVVSLFLFFGRGQSIVYYLTTILTILGGAYFPLDVLPNWVQSLSDFNPFALTLIPIRQYFLNGDIYQLLESGVVSLCWATGLLIIGSLLFFKSINFFKVNDQRFTFDF